MSTSTSRTQLWGKICLHNKLLNPAQWQEALSIHQQGAAQTPIEDILLAKKFIAAKHVEVVRKKIQEILDKQKLSAAPASSSVPTPAAPTHTTASSAPTHDDGSIPLAASTEVAGTGSGDYDWVEATGKTTPPAPAPASHTADALDDELAPIALAGDEDAPAPAAPRVAPSTKIKPSVPENTAMDTEVTSRVTPSSKISYQAPTISFRSVMKAKASGDVGDKHAARKVQWGAGEAMPEEDSRIPSPVMPGNVDPKAMEILRKGVELGASDVHLAAGSAPFYRLHGRMVFIDHPKLTADQARHWALGFMDDRQQQIFLKHHDLDFSFEIKGLARFRVNALEQFRGGSIIFRIIPPQIPTLKELGLPESLAKFTEWHQGLVLITGPAGSGKTTTAAAMVDLVNSQRHDHIITVEDPIEFLHTSKHCNVTQRQVVIHTQSFADALRAALREDPDVIMIGEMRDLETVSLAIRAAETGHLVIGTLQTKSAARTIDRVVDVFPSDQQAQIRTMLSESLRGIISQQLIPTLEGKRRVAALEILHVNTAVSNLIRDAKTFQLPSLMQTGRRIGQRTMDDSLHDLIKAGLINKETAQRASENPKVFA